MMKAFTTAKRINMILIIPQLICSGIIINVFFADAAQQSVKRFRESELSALMREDSKRL